MIVAKTKLRKIPSGCRKCLFYQTAQRSVYWYDTGMCLILWRETSDIVVSRQRLPECPLTEMEASGT